MKAEETERRYPIGFTVTDARGWLLRVGWKWCTLPPAVPEAMWVPAEMATFQGGERFSAVLYSEEQGARDAARETGGTAQRVLMVMNAKERRCEVVLEATEASLKRDGDELMREFEEWAKRGMGEARDGGK